MPLRKSPNSLEALCLNKIGEYIDKLQESVKLLPNCLVDQLYRAMKKNGHKRSKFILDCFIRPETRKLEDLNTFIRKTSPHNGDVIVNRISGVCKNLRVLSLANIPGITKQTLLKLIPNIPQSEKLNFSNTSCTDDVLGEINRHCIRLQHLNVSGCRVSDVGIESLCGVNAKILSLNIRHSDVTIKGGLHVLKTFTALQEFSCHFTNTILASLKSERIVLPFNKLRSLFPYTVSSEIELEIVAKLFPKLRQLASRYVKTDLSKFAQFKDLETFSVSRRVSIDGKVAASLLQSVNNRLTSLFLYNVTQLDVGIIGRQFPTLRSLTLNQVSISHEFTTCPGAFRLLRQLEIDVNYSPISILNLKLLLAHNLEDVYICRCDSLTDAVVTEVLGPKNAFVNLKYLYFIDCEFISAKSVMTMLTNSNAKELRTMYVLDCTEIEAHERSLVQSYVESNNLDVQINWQF